MMRLASVINAFDADLLAQYGSRLNADQRRALAAMKRCRHKNLVTLHEVIDDPAEDTLYLVLEYLSGGVSASAATAPLL